VVTGLALDAIFPMLHGPYGEDGTIQGLLELANIPYVGAGVLASAVGMDKAVMKVLFAARGLPVCPYRVVLRHEWEAGPDQVAADLEKALKFPMFVKPANL
jgi:D-alanine-D-alanine ligase